MVTRILNVSLALLGCFSIAQAAFFAVPVSGAEVTREQARAAAHGLIASHPVGTASELTVGGIRAIESSGGVFTIIADLLPQGFVVVSADTRLEPILAYNFSGTPPFRDLAYAPLLHLVLADVSARLRMIKERPAESRERVRRNERRWRSIADVPDGSGAGQIETWGPLLQRQPNPNNRHLWGQVRSGEAEDYNSSCPLVGNPLKTEGDPLRPLLLARPPVGGAAVSICQIMEYWQYPRALRFLTGEEGENGGPPGGEPPGQQVGVGDIEPPDSYEFARCMLETGGACRLDELIRIPEDAALRNFSTFSELSGECSYNAGLSELAESFFKIGTKLQTRYGSRGSAVEASAERYLEELLFGSARQAADPAGVWNQSAANIASTNIQLDRPCHLSIKGLRLVDQKPIYHSVVLDGYRSTGEFHLTFGWDGTGNAWYSLPDIRVITDQDDGEGVSFDVIRKLIYDISPQQAWAQPGGNSRNSFQSPYAAPVEDELQSKWRVSANAGGGFRGLIVGQGNTTFATAESPPALWKISQFGDVRGRLEFENETAGITAPVQNSMGEIFVGFSSGRIYRIDSALRFTLVFSEPSDAPISPGSLAVDEDDELYFRTEGENGRVYKIGRTGDLRWETAVGLSNSDSIAVNNERNRVYFSFFSFNTVEGYLVALDTATGSQAGRFTTQAEGLIEMAISAPSIDQDGNVFVSIAGGLAKLDWNLQPLAGRRDLSLPPQIPAPPLVPVIGNRGNILFPHLMTDAEGRPQQAVSSLDSDTLSTRWVWSRPADSMGFITGQAYSAINDVVLVSFWRPPEGPARLEGDTQVIALRDLGNRPAELWTHYQRRGYSYSLAGGAGATVYLYGAASDSQGRFIYAFSEGRRGNPREAGGNFLNNTAPGAASGPSPADGSLGVEGDPEPEPEDCGNGIDDDQDGQTDCADAECTDSPLCDGVVFEVCDNNRDDDLDGDVDCLDDDCDTDPFCVGPGIEICENMVDDDGDGDIDCEDLDCANHPNCIKIPPGGDPGGNPGGGVGAGRGDGFGAGRRDGPPLERTVSWDLPEDSDGDTLTFDVWLCERTLGDQLFVNVGHGLTNTFFTFDKLKAGTGYLWRVDTTDGQGLTEGPVWEFSTVNEPPAASVLAPATVFEGATVVLDAGESSDPDGSALQFEWSQISGPAVELEFDNYAASTLGALQGSPRVQFLAPAPEGDEDDQILVFRVVVGDGLATDQADVTVTVRPAPGEICGNGIDDDKDGDADCEDTDCEEGADCREPGEPTFVRGDTNSDGAINLTDGVIPLLFLFSGGDAPGCLDAADANDSGIMEITDAI
ncbi:MAG: C10 family peptidase, partial [Myxococcota bacterium]